MHSCGDVYCASSWFLGRCDRPKETYRPVYFIMLCRLGEFAIQRDAVIIV